MQHLGHDLSLCRSIIIHVYDVDGVEVVTWVEVVVSVWGGSGSDGGDSGVAVVAIGGERNFAPTAVLTKSGIVPISTARQSSSRAAAPLSAARPINTAAPKLFVNVAKTKPNVFQKAHSLSRRPFNQQTALNNRSLNNKVNTAKVNYVNTAKGKRVTSAVGEQGINAVKSSACWVWRPKRNIDDHVSKNSGDPQVALKDTRIFNSGCSKHMTGNNTSAIGEGRSLIEELDMDADISLVPPHPEIQEKIREQEVSTADTALNTANVPISTASETPQVSTAAEKVQEERLGHEEAIRLQEQINKEERKRIARDAEIAKQLQEEYDKAVKKEVVTEVDTAHVIDWNDPSVIRYHALQNRPRSVAKVRKNMMVYLKNQGGYKIKDFKGMSYDDIRPIFEKVWDQIHSFVPMDSSEEEVPRLKRAGQDVEVKPAKRQRTEEVLELAQEQTDEEPKTDELSQEQ
ncbi:hypothetical protein Tco_0899296, partial [Tanacetum coccineum]